MYLFLNNKDHFLLLQHVEYSNTLQKNASRTLRFLGFWIAIYWDLEKFIPIYDAEVYLFYDQLNRKFLEEDNDFLYIFTAHSTAMT